MADSERRGGRGRGFLFVAVLALIAAAAALFVRVRPAALPVPLAGAPAVPEPPPPPPPPPPPWTAAQLRDLASAVGGAGREGLRPADYDEAALSDAIAAGSSGPAVDALATRAAAALAHDYAAGRVRNRHRFHWHIDYAGPDAATLAKEIVAARQAGRLGAWFEALLPTSDAYRALRTALAATPDDDPIRRDRIEANLERWRWLPRDYGEGDRIVINLPTYRVDLIEGGERVASYKAVIGAADMPTPVLSGAVRQVIANPDWIVPASIVRKSHIRPSAKYQFLPRPGGGVRVRQRPGSGNALGKVKVEFANKLAIYFHDTPAKSLFARDARAFSHGCIRVQGIAALAGSIVPDRVRYEAAMAGSKTRGFKVAHPWRADIVYLTMVPDGDGGVRGVGDPYGLDAPLAAAIENRPVRKAVPPPSAPKPLEVAPPVPEALTVDPAALDMAISNGV